MSEELRIEIRTAVKEGINGQLVAIHNEIRTNQDEARQLICDLSDKNDQQNIELRAMIAPWETGRNWIAQLFKGIVYIGLPAGAAVGIYKFLHLIFK